MITTCAPDLEGRIVDLLISALLRDENTKNVIDIDSAIYAQARQLALAVDVDWRPVLLSLADRIPPKNLRIPPKNLLYRPHLWFRANDPGSWKRAVRLFACDCAERMLPLFEKKHPNDTRPRQAIETARRFAQSKATLDELRIAQLAAWTARDDVWDATETTAWNAAQPAAMAAVLDDVWDAAETAKAAAETAKAAAETAKAAAETAKAAAWAAVDAAARAVAWGAAGDAWDAERSVQWALIVDRLCASDSGIITETAGIMLYTEREDGLTCGEVAEQHSAQISGHAAGLLPGGT